MLERVRAHRLPVDSGTRHHQIPEPHRDTVQATRCLPRTNQHLPASLLDHRHNHPRNSPHPTVLRHPTSKSNAHAAPSSTTPPSQPAKCAKPPCQKPPSRNRPVQCPTEKLLRTHTPHRIHHPTSLEAGKKHCDKNKDPARRIDTA